MLLEEKYKNTHSYILAEYQIVKANAYNIVLCKIQTIPSRIALIIMQHATKSRRGQAFSTLIPVVSVILSCLLTITGWRRTSPWLIYRRMSYQFKRKYIRSGIELIEYNGARNEWSLRKPRQSWNEQLKIHGLSSRKSNYLQSIYSSHHWGSQFRQPSPFLLRLPEFSIEI